MRYICWMLLLLGLVLAADATAALAKEPAERKIRVLLTYGGHGFEEKLFFAMFDAFPGVVYTKAKMPEAANLLKPSLKKDYDVVVMYDMAPSFTPEQQKQFVALLNEGIGLISLHHNIGAHRDWDEFRKIIGGIHIPRVFVVDGIKYGPSGATDDQKIRVTVVDKQHPITAGVDDFTIHDETYHKYYTSPDVKVLLKTDHPKNEPPVAWVHRYGRSRVFYFMLGHGPTAWQNPNYPRILLNGIRWVAGRGDHAAGGKTEKERAAAACRASDSPPSGDPFGLAVRRIEQRGGQFGFDQAGSLVTVDLASDRVSVSDDDLGCLVALPHLRQLKLSGSGITNTGIGQISRLAGLRELSLLDAQIDDAGVEQLTGLTGLTSLSIRRSSQVTDKSLQSFGRLGKLRELGLLDLPITDSGLEQIGGITSLKLLDLRGCSQLSDAGLQRLKTLKSLKTLRLGGGQVTDETLAIVAGFPALAGLTLDEAAVTDAGLKRLAALPLEEITFSRCFGVTDDAFQQLAAFPALRQLTFRAAPVTGSGLAHIGEFKRLAVLRLSETGVDDDAIKHLRGSKTIARLELRRTQITDASVAVLSTLGRLRLLDIGQTAVSEAGARQLAKALPKCKIVR
jgi:uncharacterized protein